jgi:hypothetical protein
VRCISHRIATAVDQETSNILDFNVEDGVTTLDTLQVINELARLGSAG